MQQKYRDNLYHSFNIEPIKSRQDKSEGSPTGYVEVKKIVNEVLKGNCIF